MGGLRVVGVLCVGIMVAIVGGLRAEEPTIPLYLYNGNVGVGTEMPAAMLDVSGNLKVRGPAAFRGFLDVGYDTDGLGKLSFHHSHTTPGNRYYTGWVYRNSQGSLALESSDSNNLNIQFGGSVNYGTLSFQSVSWNAETSQKTATTRMVIKGDSGNVGIGTTDPGSLLTIGTKAAFVWSPSLEVRDTMRLYDASSSSHGLRMGFVTNQPYLQGYRETVGAVNLLINPNGGNVGIGTTNPGGMLSVYRDQNAATVLRVDNPNVGVGAYSGIMLGNGASGVNFLMTGTGYTSPYAINNPGGGATIYTGSASINGLVLGTSSGPLKFFAGSITAERMRVDGSGRLLVGTTSPVTLEGTSRVQLAGGSHSDATISVIRYTNDAWGGGLQIGKTRGTSPTDMTTVVNGDRLGFISFFGANGTNLTTLAAFISSEVDGVASTGIVPGRIAFHTRTNLGTLAERMRITSSGNIGIGHASPTAKLHVEGVADSGVILRINSGVHYQGLNFAGAPSIGNGVVEVTPVTVPGSGTASQYTYFKTIVNGTNTGKTEHGVIVDGKVGIGTTTPTTKLQVIGTVNATAFVGDGSGLTNISGGWSSAGTGVFYTDRKVGVGTSVPNAAFDVATGSIVLNSNTGTSTAVPVLSTSRVSGEISAYGSNGFGSDAGFLRLSAGGGTTIIEKSYIDLTGYNTIANDRNTIRLGTAGVERVRITSAGNVGIGTATPTEKLDVNGYIRTSSGPSAHYGWGSVAAIEMPAGDLDLERPNLTVGKRVYRFNQHTGMSFSAHSYYGGIRFYNQGSDSLAGYKASGGASLVMALTNGSVGIGIATPNAKLHVNGTLRATDTLTYPRTYFQYDSRQRKPSDQSPGTFSVGFGSFNNNNVGPYADTLTLNTYPDSSGGRVNMLALNKSTIGMRIYSGAFGDTALFSDYREVVLATPSGNVGISGKIGIGTTIPKTNLEIVETLGNYGPVMRLSTTGSSAVPGQHTGGLEFFNSDADIPSINAYIRAFAGPSYGVGGELAFGTQETWNTGVLRERLRITSAGNVGIGTPSPTQPLHVSGNALISSRMAINAAIDNAYALNVGGAIRATEMVVNLNGWADYVFDPEYVLRPLSEVERFVKEKRHLPGVPSEAELAAAGLNMAKMQTLQMQKIEELTLYVIALEKQNKALEARMEALEKRVSR